MAGVNDVVDGLAQLGDFGVVGALYDASGRRGSVVS